MAKEQRILIIEDQPEMAQAIQRVLKKTEYEIQIATDGFHAGALLNTLHPIMVTLDLRMPGLDGFEVLDYIRSNPDLSDTKILVISAELDDNLDRAIQSGADAVLSKPFENKALISIIQSLMQSSS
ncbi:MAG: response regulator [Pseudomonadales bacterium]|nr:response regulator [Pseudomonadales bacterium]